MQMLRKLENLEGERAVLYKNLIKEVQSKKEEWEDKIGIIEEIVFGCLLLKGETLLKSCNCSTEKKSNWPCLVGVGVGLLYILRASVH